MRTNARVGDGDQVPCSAKRIRSSWICIIAVMNEKSGRNSSALAAPGGAAILITNDGKGMAEK